MNAGRWTSCRTRQRAGGSFDCSTPWTISAERPSPWRWRAPSPHSLSRGSSIELLPSAGHIPQRLSATTAPEFASRELDRWAHRHGVKLDFIDRGKPVQNCFVESFNGRVREECLNLHWFIDLADARGIVAAWMREYNEDRRHGSLGKKTPRQFAMEWKSAMETAENAESAFTAVPTAPATTAPTNDTNNPSELTL